MKWSKQEQKIPFYISAYISVYCLSWKYKDILKVHLGHFFYVFAIVFLKNTLRRVSLISK